MENTRETIYTANADARETIYTANADARGALYTANEYVKQMYSERAALFDHLAEKATPLKYRLNYSGKRVMQTCSIYSGTLLSLNKDHRPQQIEAYSARALLEQIKEIIGNNTVEINGKTYRIK